MLKSQNPKQVLYRKLRVAGIVKETLETKGWTEILGPLLEKRINSVIGYKNDKNIYVDGYIDHPKEPESYYRGYKMALTDVWNDAYHHLIALERIGDRIKHLDDMEGINDRA